MKNTKEMGTVKAALGFILVLVILAGAMFGLDIDVAIEDGVTDEVDTEAPVADEQDEDKPETPDEPVVDEPTDEEPTDSVDQPTDEPVDEPTDVTPDAPVEGTVEGGDEANVPQDSAPTDTNEDADNSGEADVAEPSEDENVDATEGEVENA
jgi:hypothetical protein